MIDDYVNAGGIMNGGSTITSVQQILCISVRKYMIYIFTHHFVVYGDIFLIYVALYIGSNVALCCNTS